MALALRTLPTPFQALAALLIALAPGLAGCGGTAREVPARADARPHPSFSAERAWSELEGLAALGPRPAGSDAAAAARRRLRAALAPTDAALEAIEVPREPAGADPPVLTHLVATLPGGSPDWLVFVAPYDSAPQRPGESPDLRAAASGAALLVELARALAQRELPFTLRFVWLEGESLRADGDEAAGFGPGPGSRGLAAHWQATGELERVRLLVAFDRVCAANLRVARDFGSHRWHRDEFWTAARRLGRVDVFPLEAGFESVEASHAAFRGQGVRPVVAIAASRFDEEGLPRADAAGAEEAPTRCTAASLETVGEVTLEAVDAIAKRLAKIDRFTRSPAAPPRAGETDAERQP